MGNPKKKRGAGDDGTPPAPDGRPRVHVLTELDQVKVLADPLRLRILEALCDEPRTTKQISAILGEKPTKLYHHIEALERIGLIRLEMTQQKRGTLEKYYLTIALSFRADESLFALAAAGGGGEENLLEIAASVLENAAAEIRQMDVAAAEPFLHGGKGILAGLKIRLSQAQAAELQGKLEGWMEEAQELDSKGAEVEYRTVLGFYPVIPPK